MPYRVIAKRLVPETHELHDLTQAQNKAIELENDGCIDVQILDPSGQDPLDTGEADKFNSDN